MTYLRADQEISQLSLETSKAAECYRYPLVKTQLGCIGCFGGTSRHRQQEGEMQPPEGRLRRRGTLTPSSPGTVAAGPTGGDGEPARPFPCLGPHPAHGPDGRSGWPASPSYPLRRWDVVAVATGEKNHKRITKKKATKKKKKEFFPRGEHSTGALAMAVGVSAGHPPCATGQGRSTGGRRAMLGFGDWDERRRRDGAASQSSFPAEHISCLSQPGRRSPGNAFTPTSTFLRKAARSERRAGEVIGRWVGDLPPKFKSRRLQPLSRSQAQAAGAAAAGRQKQCALIETLGTACWPGTKLSSINR